MNSLTNFLGAAVVLFTAGWVLTDCTAHAGMADRFAWDFQDDEPEPARPPVRGYQLLDYMPPRNWKPLGPVPPIVFRYVPEAMLPEACGLAPGGLKGCSIRRHDKCTIIMGFDESEDMMEAVRIHETAHCGGWSHP